MNEPLSNEVTNLTADCARPGPLQSTSDDVEIALQLRDAAVYLSELDEHNSAVLILSRREVLLAIRGLLNRRGVACPNAHLAEEDWQHAEQVAPIRELLARVTVQRLAALKASLCRDAELFF